MQILESLFSIGQSPTILNKPITTTRGKPSNTKGNKHTKKKKKRNETKKRDPGFHPPEMLMLIC
jgi:hypothetical protein